MMSRERTVKNEVPKALENAYFIPLTDTAFRRWTQLLQIEPGSPGCNREVVGSLISVTTPFSSLT